MATRGWSRSRAGSFLRCPDIWKRNGLQSWRGIGCLWCLKGPNRGRPLTPKGLEQIMRGARERAGMTHATCHELRHTCLTRLREAGTSMEAGPATTGRPLQRNPPTAPVAGMSCRVT